MSQNINSSISNERNVIIYNENLPPSETVVKNNQCDRCGQKLRRLQHATTGLIYFAYIVAYTLQNSLVINYVESNLLHKYNVTSCEPNATNLTVNSEEVDDSDENAEESDAGEECENEFKKWNLYLSIVFALPAFVLAPFFASWSDSLHRLVPMQICILGMIISAVAVPLAIIFYASNEIATFCLYPASLTGGIVVFTVIVFGFEADAKNGFKIFERFLELTAISVTAGAVCQLILTVISSLNNGDVINAYVIWVPIICLLLALIQMFLRSPQIGDRRDSVDPDQNFCFKILPVNFYHFCKCPQATFIFMLFVCAFLYYLLYVGESLEIIEVLEEPWQISFFSKQGVIQSVAATLSLFVCVYLSKKAVEKRVVDKKIVAKYALSYAALLAFGLDFVTKLIITFVTSPSIQVWVPTIGVVCELAIIVIRYFAVLIVPKKDAAKSLSVLAWAQLLAVFPAPLFVQAIHTWCETFWENFVFLFMGLLLIIPSILLWIVGKFGQLPLPDLKNQEQEENEEKSKPSRGKRLIAWLTKSGYDTNI